MKWLSLGKGRLWTKVVTIPNFYGEIQPNPFNYERGRLLSCSGDTDQSSIKLDSVRERESASKERFRSWR